jgi:DNA invertase Pin-like site-specific DNA recombinase
MDNQRTENITYVAGQEDALREAIKTGTLKEFAYQKVADIKARRDGFKELKEEHAPGCFLQVPVR